MGRVTYLHHYVSLAFPSHVRLKADLHSARAVMVCRPHVWPCSRPLFLLLIPLTATYKARILHLLDSSRSRLLLVVQRPSPRYSWTSQQPQRLGLEDFVECKWFKR